jgi:NIMA (never in mitosis gene a)-related kinase 1/4/5
LTGRLNNINKMEKQSNLRDFEVLSKLGEGAFGQVFRVKRLADGKEYALKKVGMGVCR